MTLASSARCTPPEAHLRHPVAEKQKKGRAVPPPRTSPSSPVSALFCSHSMLPLALALARKPKPFRQRATRSKPTHKIHAIQARTFTNFSQPRNATDLLQWYSSARLQKSGLGKACGGTLLALNVNVIFRLGSDQTVHFHCRPHCPQNLDT